VGVGLPLNPLDKAKTLCEVRVVQQVGKVRVVSRAGREEEKVKGARIEVGR
jgi:hypothetical protein